MKSVQTNILLFSALLVGLSSCLKKDAMNIDPDTGTKNVVEFANTGDNVSGSLSTYPRFTSDLGSVAAGKSVDFNVNVSYSGEDVAPEDITVTLAVDTSALSVYNTENGSNYVAPPASIYTFPNTVVITKGTRQSQVKVTVTNNSNFDFSVNYGLPLKIASASTGTISSNFGKAIYSFSARNSYDGVYTMDATAPMVDNTSAGLTGYYPLHMHLVTFTGNSVALYDGNGYYSKNYYHPIMSGSSVSAYGSFSPVFFFDSNGKITSCTNYYGQESGGNLRSCVLNPIGVNKATFNTDGTIKTIEVNYIMTQSVSSPYAPRTYFYEKFTYEKPR
jgi:hypothetical protein